MLLTNWRYAEKVGCNSIETSANYCTLAGITDYINTVQRKVNWITVLQERIGGKDKRGSQAEHGCVLLRRRQMLYLDI